MWIKVGSGPDEGKKALVEGEVFTVGSGGDAHFEVHDDAVALAHAFFKTLSDGRVELHDLGSEAGTFVNGERLDGSVLLLGDEDVRVGETVIVLSLGDPDAADGTLEAEAAVISDEGDPATHYAEAPPPEPEAPPAPGEPVPPGTRRIYSGRAAIAYLRQMRRTTRRALALAAAAGLAALVVLVLALTGAIGGDDEIDSAAIVDAVTDATVVVRAADDRGAGGGGSGWVLDAEEGLVVTNFHVINGATQIEAGPPDDAASAELVAAAPCEDIAVLKVDGADGLKDMPLGSQDQIDQGDEVVAVGYPANASLEEQLTATAGVVSVTESKVRDPRGSSPVIDNAIQTDVALSPGNSGGPLVSQDTKLVGVTTAILTQLAGQPIQGQSYAIGIDRVKELLDEGLRDGRSRGYLGGGLGELPGRERRRREVPDGVLLVGPADGVGLPPGAEVLLVGVNGARVDSLAAYCSAVGDIESGDEATLSVVERPDARPRDVEAKFE